MRKFLLMLLVLLMAAPATTVEAQKRKDRKALFSSANNYEVETIRVGADGTKFIKVWGFGKKVDIAVAEAKKNAVAACIFRGLPSASTAMATPALCSDPNAGEQHRDYFNNFFTTGGTYLKFVNMTTDGVPSGQDRRQVKGGYKVAIYVQVMYDNLRRQLEADGIIRKLNSGF